MIHVDLKGTIKEFEAGVSAADVAKSIGMGLYKSACAAKVNGEVCDLRTALTEDCSLEILTFADEEGKQAFWHTAAHMMAQAIQRLYPEAHFGIGPSLEDGWYYDVGGVKPFTPDDFPAIEAEMKKIIKLIDEGKSEEEIKNLCISENLFGAAKEYRAKRIYGYIWNRAKKLDKTLIDLFVNSDLATQKIINLVAILRTDRLFFEFMFEVYREKNILGIPVIEESDVNIFFNNKEV